MTLSRILSLSHLMFPLTDSVDQVIARFEIKTGHKPQYVWYPTGHTLDQQQVTAWQQRGVIISHHPGAKGYAYAGPIDNQMKDSTA